MPPWGRPWGIPYRAPDGRRLQLHRHGQRCRFYDEAGEQVGPEQANVVPAIAAAYAAGWRLDAQGRSADRTRPALDASDPLTSYASR